MAATASHNDLDNTLQGDLIYKTGSHTLGTGFYLGEYRVIADDALLVFPADANGNQTSTTHSGSEYSEVALPGSSGTGVAGVLASLVLLSEAIIFVCSREDPYCWPCGCVALLIPWCVW